jgi:hypothetical protein
MPFQIEATNSVDLNDFLSTLTNLTSVTGWINRLLAIASLGYNAYQVKLVEEVLSFEFEEEGEHWIDCTYLPTLATGLADFNIGWGGGLRKIVTTCPVEVTSDCPDCPEPPTPPPPELRLNPESNCIEWRNADGIWECRLPLPPTYRATTGENDCGCDCDDCSDCPDCEDCEDCLDDCEDCCDE